MSMDVAFPGMRASVTPALRRFFYDATSMRVFRPRSLGFFAVVLAAQAATAEPRVERAHFGKLSDGTPVERFTLANSGGMEIGVITFGGVITSIRVPDRSGQLDAVVLGYRTLEEYVADTAHFGALTGRYANRIAGARFTLDGRTYALPANHRGHTLHGGFKGFDKAVWNAEPFEHPGAAGVVLTHTSADGDQGFPGTLRLRVTYTLDDANTLSLDYSATTDRPTVLNLTHHEYFNLAGPGSGDVLGHVLTIRADRYTPVDATLIPLGELASVAGTPFDFRAPTTIGARIDSSHPQVRIASGYDHNFVLTRGDGSLVRAAHVVEPQSGRVLDVYTTEPGLQFYVVGSRDAFCLETQHFPDSPNKPQFPTTTLRPGEMFRSRTVYAFSTAQPSRLLDRGYVPRR
jgi:aldose 1-epimerase